MTPLGAIAFTICSAVWFALGFAVDLTAAYAISAVSGVMAVIWSIGCKRGR